MKSYSGSNSSLVNTFITLSQNSASLNSTLAGILINEQYKYLCLKYFDLERTLTMETVGPQSLTITTAVLPAGSTSATLSSPWTFISCHQLVVFSDGEQRTVFFTQGSTAISWQTATNVIQTTNVIACVGVQSYPLPVNVSKVTNVTISVGQLVYTPQFVLSVGDWTRLNALPYTAAIVAYAFVYNQEINFYPIPSATGNIITINHNVNVPDLTYTDVTGTLATNGISIGSNTVTATATPFSTFPIGVDLTAANLFLTVAPPGGDGLYYQVQSFTSSSVAVLAKPIVNAPAPNGAAFTVGQFPVLSNDFQDTIVYGALRTYFSTISKDTDKAGYFGGLYQEKMNLMESYLATKQISVDLGTSAIQRNSNLFTFVPPQG